MLYSIDSGKYVKTLPHKKDYDKWCKHLSDGDYAKIIDELGIKGEEIGGAQVSTKHCGFIVSKAKATVDDIEDLINLIKEKVKEERGILLETEIIVVEK